MPEGRTSAIWCRTPLRTHEPLAVLQCRTTTRTSQLSQREGVGKVSHSCARLRGEFATHKKCYRSAPERALAGFLRGPCRASLELQRSSCFLYRSTDAAFASR